MNIGIISPVFSGIGNLFRQGKAAHQKSLDGVDGGSRRPRRPSAPRQVRQEWASLRDDRRKAQKQSDCWS
jgi:hypothetical protein